MAIVLFELDNGQPATWFLFKSTFYAVLLSVTLWSGFGRDIKRKIRCLFHPTFPYYPCSPHPDLSDSGFFFSSAFPSSFPVKHAYIHSSSPRQQKTTYTHMLSEQAEVCTPISTKERTRAHVCTHTHTHRHTHIYTHTDTDTHTDTHTHTHTHRACICTLVYTIQAWIHTHTHDYMHVGTDHFKLANWESTTGMDAMEQGVQRPRPVWGGFSRGSDRLRASDRRDVTHHFTVTAGGGAKVSAVQLI